MRDSAPIDAGKSGGREKEEEETKNELFERVLEDSGGFGRFQVFFLALSPIISFLCSSNNYSPIYTAYKPRFTCQDGSSFNSTCPEDGGILGNCPDYAFDTSVMERTVATDFRLFCDRESLASVLTSSYMAGVMVMSILSGFLADNYGRRPVLLVSALIHIVTSFVTAFATSYTHYALSRFFVGGSITVCFSIAFVLANEICVVDKRGLTVGVFCVGWPLGAILMIGVAYSTRNWIHMQLVFAVFSLLLFVFYFVFPESPRWLLLNNRTEEGRKVYETLAKRNGVDLSKTRFDHHFNLLLSKCKEEDFGEPKKFIVLEWLGQLAHREYRIRFIVLAGAWFAVGTAFYGVHFSVEYIDFDIFLLGLYKELASAAGTICMTLVYDKFYRTPFIFSLYVLGGLLGMSMILIPSQAILFRVLVYLCAQAVLFVAFVLADEVTAEEVPTDARTITLVILDGISKLGTTIAPFLVLLGSISPDLPLVTFGCIMVAASVGFWWLHEPKGQPLVQTVRDMDKEERRTMATCVARTFWSRKNSS